MLTVFIIIAVIFVIIFFSFGSTFLTILVIKSSIEKKGKMGINLGHVKCPECGEDAPKVRIPKNFPQAMFGGWTCSKCGTEMDKWGKVKVKI